MADRPQKGSGEAEGEEEAARKPVVPPVVPPAVAPVPKPVVPPLARPVVVPVARPVVPAVARPVVPPTVPPVAVPVARPVVPPAVPPVAVPVARPVVPPAVPPVAAPVARPVVPPAVAPVAPPVAAPVAPPVVRPAVPPAAPPVVRPIATPTAPPPVAKPVASGPGGARRARGEAEETRPSRPGRESRGAAANSKGLGVGGKVGLLTALVAALALALAVLPGLKADMGDDALEAFHAAGMNTAIALGAGLGTGPAPAAAPTAKGPKAMELLATDLEAQIKELNLGGDARLRIGAVVGALKNGLAGKSVAKDIGTLLDDVQKQLAKVSEGPGKDEEKAQPLRAQRERLIRIQNELEAASPTAEPATPAGARLPLPGGADPYRPKAAWLQGEKGPVLAQTDASLALPSSTVVTLLNPPNRNYGWYAWAPGGATYTVFFAPVGDPALSKGRVFVAFPDPPAASSSSSNKIGLLMLVLGPLLVGGLGFVVASSHGKPLKDLARELERLGSSGDPARRIAAHGPEANAIARSVERMVSNLKFRDQHQMADLQEVISKEQGVAAEIHHGLMPRNPPRLPGWEVETLFKPGFEIGGDHFDYFRIDDTHLGVILMDTSVRGIPAAIVMSMARAYVRAQAPGVLSPADVLMRVNRLLAADLSQGQYVTALYVVIDTSSGTAKVASAGHLPLVVYRHAIGKTAIVNPEGIALGLDSGPVFDRSVSEVELQIGVGDRLVLHTDGALDVLSETGEEFGEARLYGAIQEKAPMNSQAFVNFVGSAIDAFHLNAPQNDDITISTVKRLR